MRRAIGCKVKLLVVNTTPDPWLTHFYMSIYLCDPKKKVKELKSTPPSTLGSILMDCSTKHLMRNEKFHGLCACLILSIILKKKIIKILIFKYSLMGEAKSCTTGFCQTLSKSKRN